MRPSPYFSCGHTDLVSGDSVCFGDAIADHGFRASLEGQPLIVLIVYFCLLWLLWDVALISPSLVFSCKIRDQGGQVQVGVLITSRHSSLKKTKSSCLIDRDEVSSGGLPACEACVGEQLWDLSFLG